MSDAEKDKAIQKAMSLAYWDYAVAKYYDGTLSIVEVHYTKEHKPVLWCKAEPCGDDLKELTEDLKNMAEALVRGVTCCIDENNEIKAVKRGDA